MYRIMLAFEGGITHLLHAVSARARHISDVCPDSKVVPKVRLALTSYWLSTSKVC